MGSVTEVTQETSSLTMSDEEYAEEESVSNTSKKGDGTFRKARGEAKKVELDEQLKEYINEWRKQRQKEEEELKKLKDKQAKRKEIRAEQEKKLAQQKKEEEERLRKEEADKKAAEAEEKRKKMEEAEKKRQEMMKAQKEKMGPAGGSKKSKDSGMGNVADVRREKTKEQLEEEKKISLSIRIHPLELDGMDIDALKEKGKELWELIVKLETEKYALEEKVKRQDYDLKELKERQRQQNKQKAIKLGLDPEALTGKYPPKIRMYPKYERRTDTRTYEDRRKLYEGGWEVVRSEHLQASWKEKYDEWLKRPKSKLPKWFGERPGKKAGDPESPEGEEDDGGAAPAAEEFV